MKVKPYNKKLLSLYIKIISFIVTFESFFLIFIEINKECRYKFFIGNICVFFITYIICIIYSNSIKRKNLKIGNTKFIVKFGDLFLESGLKVIPFNEFFDTQVDENLISKNSLNGKVLTEKIKDIKSLDKYILQNPDCKKNIKNNNVKRIKGKNIQYNLGTCFKYNDIVPLAFSRFDEQNHAFLSQEDYFTCLINFWKELNLIYDGENISIPLLGSGITRGCLFEKSSKQELLNIMIATLKYSNLSFSNDITITIILSKNLSNEISIFDI